MKIMKNISIRLGKGETDDPLAQWDIGEYFIREKGRCLGHAAGSGYMQAVLLTRRSIVTRSKVRLPKTSANVQGHLNTSSRR
jgi:hypothetical protein